MFSISDMLIHRYGLSFVIYTNTCAHREMYANTHTHTHIYIYIHTYIYIYTYVSLSLSLSFSRLTYTYTCLRMCTLYSFTHTTFFSRQSTQGHACKTGLDLGLETRIQGSMAAVDCEPCEHGWHQEAEAAEGAEPWPRPPLHFIHHWIYIAYTLYICIFV